MTFWLCRIFLFMPSLHSWFKFWFFTGTASLFCFSVFCNPYCKFNTEFLCINRIVYEGLLSTGFTLAYGKSFQLRCLFLTVPVGFISSAFQHTKGVIKLPLFKNNPITSLEKLMPVWQFVGLWVHASQLLFIYSLIYRLKMIFNLTTD